MAGSLRFKSTDYQLVRYNNFAVRVRHSRSNAIAGHAGHTKEDVDQLFSVISGALKRLAEPIPTPSALIDFLETKVLNGQCHAKYLRNVYDFEKYYSNDLLREVRGLG